VGKGIKGEGMKRLLLLLNVLLIIACSKDFDDINYKITNNSSKTVLFFFYNTNNILNSNESVSYIINSGEGMFSPKNIELCDPEDHPKSIKMDKLNLGTNGYIYEFKDNQRYVLSVINTLPIQVTIKSDDYIDHEGELTLTIPANERKDSHIYTSKPNFSLISETFPITFDWILNNNIVYLTIR